MPRKNTVKKRPTIYELAKLANVSSGTVSRVLNNRIAVNAKTRARVMEMAHKIGLKPRMSARTKQIAIVTEQYHKEHLGSYAAILTAHLAFAFSEQGIGVLLPSDPLHQLGNDFIDGIVVVGCGQEILEKVQVSEKMLPVVYFDHFEAQEHQYTVNSDFHDSGYQAAKAFIKAGRKKLGFVSTWDATYEERLKGFIQAMEEEGAEVDRKRLGMEKEQGSLYLSLNRAVNAGADSIFVPGVSMQAIECLYILGNMMKLSVPKDISVIGGESSGVSKFLTPPLTTIDYPLKEMARIAADLVINLADGKEVPQRHITLPIKLIERDSV